MDSRKIETVAYQEETLKQFRLNLQDILTPNYADVDLLRWLTAKNFDLEKAEEHFRQVYLTQKFYGFDKLLANYVKPEVFEKYETNSFLGFAKDGSLIRYMSMNFDMLGFMQSSSTFEQCIYCSYIIQSDLDAVKNANIKNGKNNNKITYIVNMERTPLQPFFHKCILEIGLDLLRLFQEWFPENWNYILIVNAPYFFDKICGMYKTIMADSFLQKVFIAKRSSTGKLLREYIDEDILPAFLGGKKVDSKGDPNCAELFKTVYPGDVPKSYYLKNSKRYIDSTDPGVTVVDIGPRSVYNVSFVIKKAGTVIKAEGRTENGGIYCNQLYREFGLDPENPDVPASDEYLDPHDKTSNVRMLGIKAKLQSHLAPVDNIIIAIWPGIYIMQFDNTDSWFSSRKLLYRFTMISEDN